MPKRRCGWRAIPPEQACRGNPPSISAAGGTLMFIASLVCMSGALAADSDELSKATTDPTKSPTSVILQGDVIPLYQDLPDGSAVDDVGGTVLFRTVSPLKLWGTSHILRASIPFAVAGPGGAGLQPVAVFDVAILPASFGRVGIGAVANFAFGAPPFTFGPVLGCIVQPSKTVTTGLFVQSGFAVGDNPVATLLFQPTLAWQLGKGWAVTLGELILVLDAYNGRVASFPLGAQIGKVVPVAKQPMRFALGGLYETIDNPGGKALTVTGSITLIVPGG